MSCREIAEANIQLAIKWAAPLSRRSGAPIARVLTQPGSTPVICNAQERPFVVDFDAIILGVGPFLAENKGSLSLPRMRSRQIQSRYEHTIYAKIAHRKRSPTPAG
jgi:hypothetical protein